MKALLITHILDNGCEYKLLDPVCITEETGFVFSQGHLYFVDMTVDQEHERGKHKLTDEEADRIAQSLLQRRGGSSRILPS